VQAVVGTVGVMAAVTGLATEAAQAQDLAVAVPAVEWAAGVDSLVARLDQVKLEVVETMAVAVAEQAKARLAAL